MTGTVPAQAYQRQADQQRRDELIVSHLPLVKHVIGRLVGELPPGTDVDNLEAAGVLGLVEAAAKYDPSRNAQFKTFAYLRVRGAVVDELRRNSPLPQHVMERVSAVRKASRTLAPPVTVEAIAAITGLTPDEVADTLAADRFSKMVSWEQTAEPNGFAPVQASEAPDAGLEREEEARELAAAIEALPRKERLVLTLYHKEGLRLKEIGEVLQLSVSRVSRLLTKATFELGEALKQKRSRDLLARY